MDDDEDSLEETDDGASVDTEEAATEDAEVDMTEEGAEDAAEDVAEESLGNTEGRDCEDDVDETMTDDAADVAMGADETIEEETAAEVVEKADDGLMGIADEGTEDGTELEDVEEDVDWDDDDGPPSGASSGNKNTPAKGPPGAQYRAIWLIASRALHRSCISSTKT